MTSYIKCLFFLLSFASNAHGFKLPFRSPQEQPKIEHPVQKTAPSPKRSKELLPTPPGLAIPTHSKPAIKPEAKKETTWSQKIKSIKTQAIAKYGSGSRSSYQTKQATPVQPSAVYTPPIPTPKTDAKPNQATPAPTQRPTPQTEAHAQLQTAWQKDYQNLQKLSKKSDKILDDLQKEGSVYAKNLNDRAVRAAHGKLSPDEQKLIGQLSPEEAAVLKKLSNNIANKQDPIKGLTYEEAKKWEEISALKLSKGIDQKFNELREKSIAISNKVMEADKKENISKNTLALEEKSIKIMQEKINTKQIDQATLGMIQQGNPSATIQVKRLENFNKNSANEKKIEDMQKKLQQKLMLPAKRSKLNTELTEALKQRDQLGIEYKKLYKPKAEDATIGLPPHMIQAKKEAQDILRPVSQLMGEDNAREKAGLPKLNTQKIKDLEAQAKAITDKAQRTWDDDLAVKKIQAAKEKGIVNKNDLARIEGDSAPVGLQASRLQNLQDIKKYDTEIQRLQQEKPTKENQEQLATAKKQKEYFEKEGIALFKPYKKPEEPVMPQKPVLPPRPQPTQTAKRIQQKNPLSAAPQGKRQRDSLAPMRSDEYNP
ncbi:hypothetical protein IPF37_02535 [bacterium]|nr:MAG: hypothetical protein IPF37_02535 [bacterium]